MLYLRFDSQYINRMDIQELQKLKNKFDIIGNNAGLNRALEMAVAIAPTDITVLITGESGVGKEVLPQIIHQYSRRRNGKYIAINCGGLPQGTINSELFGHEKGSFTGAIGERKGYFEDTARRTIFLDEIGELPMSTQAMLLRVLQDGEYMKVGSSKVEKTDVRVVAATNVNLLYAVSRGKFRSDLYYRLNAIQIKMPSLRERKDDIYLLFRKFAADFSEKYNMTRVGLSHDAIAALQSYRWPGNIRQLKNTTEGICALEGREISRNADRIELDAQNLMKYLPKEENSLIPAMAESEKSGGMSSDEKEMFIKALIDIKRDVDELKAKVYGTKTPVAQLPQEDDEAEWQGGELPEEDFTRQHRLDLHAEEDLSLENAEKERIFKALKKHEGNRKAAAAELGISERTLYRRIKDMENNEN